DAKFTFDNYSSFENNILAFNACYNIACNSEGFEDINLLFICGKMGLGKSHLLHATAKQAINLASYKKVLYLSAEKFMFTYVRAMKENKMLDFKDYVRGSDLLIVDDIQFICGKSNFQEELFHTVNAVIDAGGKVILSADKFPNQLTGLEDKIKSRFSGGLIADIKNYSNEQRFEILAKKAEKQNQKVGSEVISFIANNVDTSIREAEGALNKILQISKLTMREADLDLAKEIVKSTYEKSKKETSLEDIKKEVCKKFGLSFTEIESATRLKKIAEARQIAMYLAKKYTTKSYPEIGRFFGGKDHATVVHAVKKIEKLISENEIFADTINKITSDF
ncbi:MAG: chromosomal replication initiator protein DnaA, partial [Rickettsiales bacterium]|nr:chromosomal replication initiator protein DnaA [Rickettsiales bacterium]